MLRHALAALIFFVGTSFSLAQGPSYAKQIRPILAKYCVECHNAKTMRGELNLDTHKAVMEGSDSGPVVVVGQPDKSKLVLLCEGKAKPMMPPAKAKFHPSKEEVAQLRAWVAAGAKDDGADVKIVLPAINAKANVKAPVSALTHRGRTFIARAGAFSHIRNEMETSAEITFKSPINAMNASQTSDWIAIGIGTPGEQGSAILHWTGLKRPAMIELPVRHADAILDIAIDPTTRIVATAGYDSTIELLDVSLYTDGPRAKPTAKEIESARRVVLKEHSDAVYGLTFSPDGKLLASVSADRAMKVFDVEKAKLLYTLGEATDWLYAVAWSPDGKYLVSGGVDKSIRVYEPTPTGAKIRQSVFAHEGAVLKLVFSSDSKTLYSVGEDRVVKAWDVEKMVERKVYERQPETVLCLALREDAGQIIVGRYDGIVQLIDMKTGKIAHEFGKEKAAPAKPRDERSDFRGSNLQHFVLQPSKIDQINVENPGKSPATALQIKLPAQLAGSLDRAGAIHFFRFDVAAGQSLGLRVQTAELKSKLDPVLILADVNGQTLAESTQGHLGYTFTKAGSYAIGVRDRDYRGGKDFTYRLHLGEFPIVTEVFPLSLPRGVKGEIRLDGVFLAKRVLPFEMPANATPGQTFKLDVGSALGKAEIVAGEFPEVIDGGKMAVPGAAHGRLTSDNQKDLWSFTAKKGQRLVVETHARRLGSRIDTVIEILDKDGQPVPRAVLRSQAKTNVTFRDHDSAQGNIRIEAWSELGINDYLYVGTELMKIQALPTHPDADCNFFATGGQRIGYFDTTPTHHANGTPMYKVSVHPPGTTFPPNGYPVFTLYYKNDDGVAGYGRDSRILFDPPADGEYKVRVSDARGMGGVNFGYRLTVRPPQPSFAIRATPAEPVIGNFNALPLAIAVDRFDGYEGPIQVRFADVPMGYSVPTTTIEAGTFTTAVALFAEVKSTFPLPKIPLKAVGEAVIDGKKVVKESGGIMPKVVGLYDLKTTTDVDAVSLKAGGQAKLLVRIERQNNFSGRVPLEVRGLPHGVRVLDIGLNGILVNENETTRSVVIYAEPWVQTQDHPIVVLARREGKNSEHAAKSVLLKISER